MMFDLWERWWNVRQSHQIVQNQQKTGKVETRVTSVDDKIERLMLINVAMWELLSASSGLSDDNLRRKIEEVDLRDGQLDGRISAPPASCRKCGRHYGRRHARCIYCGTASEGSPFGK
jgi:hypothetical protein